MIISPARGYVFVHIPKTGGTSLATALEARACPDDILLGDTPEARRRRRNGPRPKAAGRLWKHSTLSDIDGILDAGALAAMLCVTMVRNPWDRAVSYYHWLRTRSFDHPAVHRAKALDFEGFLADDATQMSFANWPVRRYLTDASGTERPALFIRLEALETDLAPLADHLGFRPAIPHLNRSERHAYPGYYAKESRAIIARTCAEDIARFGYRFDPDA